MRARAVAGPGSTTDCEKDPKHDDCKREGKGRQLSDKFRSDEETDQTHFTGSKGAFAGRAANSKKKRNQNFLMPEKHGFLKASKAFTVSEKFLKEYKRARPDRDVKAPSKYELHMKKKDEFSAKDKWSSKDDELILNGLEEGDGWDKITQTLQMIGQRVTEEEVRDHYYFLKPEEKPLKTKYLDNSKCCSGMVARGSTCVDCFTKYQVYDANEAVKENDIFKRTKYLDSLGLSTLSKQMDKDIIKSGERSPSQGASKEWEERAVNHYEDSFSKYERNFWDKQYAVSGEGSSKGSSKGGSF
jgi:hypothetical protein